MIDEFQDTSTVQWQNFRVLLLETMSHRDSENLIVGDVKQSIYRWRSGDWRLLNDIEQQFHQEMIHTESLKTNRRSERRIIDFNNAFFTEAARMEYEKLEQQPEADQLQRAYQDVEQLIPDGKPEAGYVHIELLPADDYQEQTLQRLADTIAGLISQGIPQTKMAILVRVNSYIPIIANYFAEHLPEVSIVSDEAFRLDASPSVNIIVQALRLLRNPDDQLARAFLKKSCGDISVLEQTPASQSLYETAEQLFAGLGLDRFDEQTAYVCAFFDQLRKYTAENAATIDEFLKLWESDICRKTIQSDVTDGVRIISIHKSKGLEFDYVLSPFCDWQMEKAGNVLWCYPDEQPFSDLPIAPIDYSKSGMVGTIYDDDYHHEHLQNVVDNLNLLYVDFTRARSGLFVFGRRGARNSRSEIIEQVLPALTLEGGELTAGDDASTPIVYEYGTLSAPAAVSQKKQPAGNDNPFLQPSVPYPVSIAAHEMKAVFKQSNQSRDFISGDDEQATTTSYIQLGNVLHRIFSTIRTSDDIGAALQQLEQEGVIYDDLITVERLRLMLRKRLEHPQVADWFSARWTLFNECTILSVDADGHVVERRPDRVMTDGSRWIVVDFKFGRPREEYHDQVREYMQLLGQMGHTCVEGYLWYVYSNKIEKV